MQLFGVVPSVEPALELPMVGYLDGDRVLNTQAIGIVSESSLLVLVFSKGARRVSEVRVGVLEEPCERSCLDGILAEVPKGIELFAVGVHIEDVFDFGGLTEVLDVFRYQVDFV